MPATRAIIEKLDSLANSSGTTVRYSWTDDLLRIYVYGGRDVAAFASRARWVLATFTILFEDSAAFKSALEKVLADLGATYSVSTEEYWSLGIAKIEAKVFASNA